MYNEGSGVKRVLSSDHGKMNVPLDGQDRKTAADVSVTTPEEPAARPASPAAGARPRVRPGQAHAQRHPGQPHSGVLICHTHGNPSAHRQGP